MSKEIDINNEEQILKECDFDYYYNSVCSRELCMFFNDIARQDSHFDKRQAYIDLGRIGIMINKLFRENTDLEAKLAEEKEFTEQYRKECAKIQTDYYQLKQQLAEKEKEIEKINAMINTLPAHDKELEEIHSQDKISFCIENLEKVKKFINEKYQYFLELEKQGNLTEHGKGSKLTNEIVLQKLHNQIEELKKEIK